MIFSSRNSYFLKYDSKQLQKMRPYPPLATLYAASALRAHGYSIALLDAMLADGEEEFVRALDNISHVWWRCTRIALTF